ncbi:BamA/TamA family outer membrane protein [Roseovarius sp. SCSIO 43702]|uniref:autotransporter assembly complex protein TamA n=1 Tax=Roseovarius sp. SCSIO 43702 TaxID=2823043 RepID=UPI001C73C8B3|nr:BamA/TamA family outer membrane protein [Roseovarius sp. SCSIO 43702]QYX57419.1 BamA/TamA family outer membrane protein [Roseovarius sp. SCSIO 43702]
MATFISAASVVSAQQVAFDIRTNDDDLREALVDASLVRSAKDEGRTDPQDIIAAANADYAKLLSVLYQFGYYSGVINIRVDGQEAARMSPFARPSGIGRVVVRVDPGRPFTFGRAEIGPLAPGTELPENFRRGERARARIIQRTVDAGIEGWRDVGRAKAELAGQNLVADHRAKTLIAQLALRPGPVVYFGDLVQTSRSAVRPERLQAIAGLPTGERFSPDELETSAKRLRRTGAFKSVSLTEAEELRDGNVMDIRMDVADEKPRRFGFGAEISGNEGLTLSSFWLHRNLLGGAERLRFDARVGGIGSEEGGFNGREGIDYEVAGRFERPATFGADTTLYVAGRIAREDEPNYLSDQIELGFGFSRIVTDKLTVEAGLALRYSDETDVTGNSEFFHLLVPLRATYDSRDIPLDPAEGYYLQAEVMPFISLDNTDSGARIKLDGRTYRQLDSDGLFTVAGRLQFGSVLGSSISDTPQEFLFYSGGGNTVRGHPYQSLGVNTGGGLTGGRSFVAASAELRVDLPGSFDPVAFYDVGYIGPEAIYDGSGRWHSGAGVGLRYATGIGPIRLDVALPVSGSTGDGVQVYIGIGQAF